MSILRSARGITADLLLVDEAAHVEAKLFTEGLFPVLRMRNTAMVCLSSPEDEQNNYSKMVNLTDKKTGETIFRVIHARQICDACMKLTHHKAILCQHIKNTAHWINHRRAQKFKALYEDPALAMREFGGMIVSSTMSAFRKDEIVRMFEAPRIRTTATPNVIFITADNSGGGSSNLALTSGYFAADGTFVVIGLDSENVTGELQEKDLLLRHVASIDAMGPHMKRAPKVFIPEVNYAMPDHLPNMLLDVPNLEVWRDPKTGRLGVWKKAGTAQQYRFAVSNALFHGMLRIEEDVFTCSTDKNGKLSVEKQLHNLQNEMERYRYVKKAPADPQFGVTKVKLSGKGGGGTQNDDLVMTFMMAVTWGMVYLLDPRMGNKLSQSVGGRYMQVDADTMKSMPNADVARARADAEKQKEHERTFAARVTTRASFPAIGQ